jgi:hypothetical protein
MPSVLLIVVLVWVGLSSAIGKEAEAANEDVPKPPPGFSPGNLTNPNASAPRTSNGSGNGAAPKTLTKPTAGPTSGGGKPAGSAPRGR